MIHFKTLRLSGFKSFIDKTELEIGPGLTGIVGPNGCGKSNLVEALRWVMGESSAKRMRGGGMEDVIFSGTDRRPARNFAEVTLFLDNAGRSAPAGYNDAEELEVIRKIVRDQGSAYRVNGKPARAKDVQLLFADTISGANSPALVSQGKVTGLINAKPLERRIILEESAGISGLHARRHDAELRLKQAEQNLIRLEDMTGSMETRLANLRRQARQAERYRKLNSRVRELERIIAYLEWHGAAEKLQAEETKLTQCEAEVSEAMATVAQLNKTYLTQTQDLPQLRRNEAEHAAALQKLKLELQQVEERAAMAASELSETEQLKEQLETDISHAHSTISEQEETIQQITLEQKRIQQEEQQAETVLASRQEAYDKAEQEAKMLEESVNILTAETAARDAKRAAVAEQLAGEEAGLAELEEEREIINAQLTELTEEQKDQQDLTELEQALSDLTARAQKNDAELANFKDRISDNDTGLEKARSALKAAEVEVAACRQEITSLERFIEEFGSADSHPVLAKISTKKGFETALSRALGDALQASTQEDQQEKSVAIWRKVSPEVPPLPKNIESLKTYISAPDILSSALDAIGLVETETDGDRLQRQLKPGQALVSKDGAYWRWDGYVMRADATDRQALFLEQKNKLQALKSALPSKEQTALTASKELDTLQKAHQSLTTSMQEQEVLKTRLSQAQQEAERALLSGQHVRTTLNEKILQCKNNLKKTSQNIDKSKTIIDSQKRTLKELDANQDGLSSDQLQTLKAELNEARQKFQEAAAALERTTHLQNSRQVRLRAISDEQVTLKNRLIKGREHLSNLEERHARTAEKLNTLKSRPQTLGPERDTMLSQIGKLENTLSQSTQALQSTESDAQETARALKQAESRLSDTKEHRAHTQATVIAAQNAIEEHVRSTEERFDCAPNRLTESLEVNLEAISLSEAREERQTLIRQRDTIGPVNLQADIEAQEIEKEMGGLLKEKDDLRAAIEELRGGIRELNNEARVRLNLAFQSVDRYFQMLFKRLFAGGTAHLSLIDSDDPLEAGLEIFAQPPGKSLQSLSLLSGGEQTMTSIALIFAMFMTNPAPICVLDEIDAPLDDANVDRVCDLLEEMAEQTKTRFLIITHHRLTMARMDRLYGVTMVEQGVSKLLSLDLQQSLGFIEEAA